MTDVTQARIEVMKKLVKDKPKYSYRGYEYPYNSNSSFFNGNPSSSSYVNPYSTATNSNLTPDKPMGYNGVLKFFRKQMDNATDTAKLNRLGLLIDRSVSLDDDTKLSLLYELDEIAEMIEFGSRKYFETKIWERCDSITKDELESMRKRIYQCKILTEEDKSELGAEIDCVSELWVRK